MDDLIKSCYNCTRYLGRNKCDALKNTKYPFKKYGSCWAWTDNPNIKQDLENASNFYKGLKIS